MSRRANISTGIAFLVLSPFVGCGGTADQDVVAKIGTEVIALEELRLFKRDTPPLFRSQKEGVEEVRDYLQTMIDMKLMLLEAREQGLDQEVEFRRKWEKVRRQILVAEFAQRKVREETELPAEELQRRFEESKWSRVLKLARIRVETEEDAQRIVRELEHGRRFEQVASERSIDQTTASEGGLLEPFYGRLNIRFLGVTPAIAEDLFELKAGETSRPFQLADHYEIFRVVEERPAPPEYRETFAQETLEAEFNNRRKELGAELAVEFEAQLDRAGISRLIEKAPKFRGETLQLSPHEQEMVLCRFEGGQLALKDFANAYRQVGLFRSVRFDSSGIAEFVNRYLLADILMYRIALREGFEQDESVAARLGAEKEKMLLEALRHKEVDQQIAISDEAVRQYYETHLDRFVRSEAVEVLEILVETQEEAEECLQKIRSGEDMETLALNYSIRQGAPKNRGHFHMHAFERAVFGALLEEAMKSEVDELKGPLQVEKGYSIFKVVQRIAAAPEPFEKAAPKAIYWIKQEEEERLFQALLARLREQYASEVVVFEDRLRTVASAVDGK